MYVIFLLTMHTLTPLSPFELKQEFDIVKKLRGLSGFGWDDADQKVIASDDVWEDYLKVKVSTMFTELTQYAYNAAYNPQEHQQHQKFQHKKFPLFDEIANLVDGTRATGANVFRAGQISLSASDLDASYNDLNIDPALRAISINVEPAKKVKGTPVPHTSVKKAPGLIL